MSSLLHLIQRSEWQFFLTFTFKNSRTMGQKARLSMQFQLLRYLASFGREGRRGESALRDLRFIIREEFGEQGGRLHWHALAYGLKPSFVRDSTCLLTMGYWQGMGGGMTRIRVYDAEQDATSYVTKGLEDMSIDTSQAGANRYEVGKFNDDDTLMLIPSHALLADWKSLAFESGRLRLALDRRRSARSDHDNTLWPVSSKAGVDNDNKALAGELFPRSVSSIQRWKRVNSRGQRIRGLDKPFTVGA